MWHELDKNKKDLPEKTDYYTVRYSDGNEGKGYFSIGNGCFASYKQQFTEKKVVAWKDNEVNCVLRVNEILNWFYSDYKDTLVKTHIIAEESLEACFMRVYALRRSARYDSARRYEFADSSYEEQFADWREKNETIEMFYGSATVD